MTVQNLYTQYLEGKVSKQKFLYEVRRDQNLTMISPSNSFDDVVKILKNKSIISEKAYKESTGKQEVEVIAKTIDMVNPYEYTRGMEFELNIMDVPSTSGDLSEDSILKAQKKVLANLTKNPQYYYEKLNGKGEVSDEWVEATKKEIEKIGKGKSKIIREGVESKLKQMGYSDSDIEDFIDEWKQGGSKLPKKVKDYLDGLYNTRLGQIQTKPLRKEISRPGYNEDGTPKSNDEMSDDEREAFYNDSDFLDEGGNLGHNEISSIHPEGAYWIVTYRGSKGTTEKSFSSEEEARKFQDGLNEHGQYADRVADVNADSSPLKEKKLRIYEKYAQKMNKTVDEVKCMVDEAIALKDKAGNIQYAKDSTEASNIERNAKTKGITLTKTAV
jgi:hypothetical protein